MTENRNQKKRGNVGIIILILICIGVIIFALAKLIPILREYRKAEQAYTDLSSRIVTETETPQTDEEKGIWWAESVDIDFDELESINPDVVGWIRFDHPEETGVDYPILHGKTNNTYLRSDIHGDYLLAGSIFLEAENAPDFSDYYNIIYGHNMKDGNMFGTLKRYKQEELYDSGNDYFTIYTKQKAYRYRIFSYRDVPDNDIIYSVGYQPDEEYQRLIDGMVKGSMKETGIVPTMNDRVLTLSTCSTAGKKVRFAIHAVLVDQRDRISDSSPGETQ